ncbi:MAG: type 1 glutamine amidotransferase domain-containing protein, partial [Byssovorax sp.]
MASKILLLVTSHDHLGSTGEKTGFWLDELAAPYRAFVEAGASVSIASPKGGRPPVDPKSESNPPAAATWFLGNEEAQAKLASTQRIPDITEPYDVYFVVGGHGAMWDLAEDPAAARLLGQAFDQGKVVAAVCHGPGALVNVRLASGDPLVKGRRVGGFSNEEEQAVKLTDVVPFSLETRLRELGGRYERGPVWKSFAVRDGRLVTGQNPASAEAVAREALEALAESAGAPAVS